MMAQFTLRWILTSDAVSCPIPGAKRSAQGEETVAAADLPPLSEETMDAVSMVYERHARDQVHHRW